MSTLAVRQLHPVAVASAGIGVVGVTFGMARYGVGLLAPDIRAGFGLSSGSLGLLATASYVAYLATSVTAAWRHTTVEKDWDAEYTAARSALVDAFTDSCVP